MDELIKVAKAAERLGDDPRNVRNWCYSGRLVAFKYGGLLLVSRNSVESLYRTRLSGKQALEEFKASKRKREK